jgi:hypothetical protein
MDEPFQGVGLGGTDHDLLLAQKSCPAEMRRPHAKRTRALFNCCRAAV